MALHNYAELDEDDYYGQPFDQEGVVSIWVGMEDNSNDPPGLEVLPDLCGVGYYDLDANEITHDGFELVPLERLLARLSFASSFVKEAVAVAERRNVAMVRYVVLQYDFAYDPTKVKRAIAKDPIFLGVFPYRTAW